MTTRYNPLDGTYDESTGLWKYDHEIFEVVNDKWSADLVKGTYEELSACWIDLGWFNFQRVITFGGQTKIVSREPYEIIAVLVDN